MSHSEHKPEPQTATIKEIARWIRHHCGESRKNRKARVTFLIGAGFSASAGIPTAGQLVKDVLRPHPLLEDVKPVPPEKSEYAFLMENIPPVVRAGIIREAIQKAEDPDTKLIRINWAHLLLATMVDARYINQILTTNFDPLVVESLSMTGQPVRAFDLAASSGFQAGALQPGSVVYLHGQAHGLWLSNSSDETDRARRHLNTVFQDALRDSIFIVVGYSGSCDPVLTELTDRFRQFRHNLYWVHPEGDSYPDKEAMKLLQDPCREARLVRGMNADEFMCALVLEGLEVAYPLIVKLPFDSLARNLSRVMPLPQVPDSPRKDDPVEKALNLVADAQKRSTKPASEESVQGDDESPMSDHLLSIEIAMAATTKSRTVLNQLRERLGRDGSSETRAALGRAYLTLASAEIEKGRVDQAIDDLEFAETNGVKELPWLHSIWGNALVAKAKSKIGAEADALFQQAGEKYAEALQIKPDMHEALNNSGNALSDQAKTKSGEEAEELFQKAIEKYIEALRIKPDKHEALANWGLTLSDQAKTKSGEEAEELFQKASEKFAEALRIKLDYHGALYNWGNALGEQARTKSGADADVLFFQAGEKYAVALRIRPDMHEALASWGTSLLFQAQTKSGAEADALFQQAIEKLTEALRIKPDYRAAQFNMACISSLRDDTNQALYWLRTWAEGNLEATKSMVEEDSDFDGIRETDEFKAFVAGLD